MRFRETAFSPSTVELELNAHFYISQNSNWTITVDRERYMFSCKYRWAASDFIKVWMLVRSTIIPHLINMIIIFDLVIFLVGRDSTICLVILFEVLWLTLISLEFGALDQNTSLKLCVWVPCTATRMLRFIIVILMVKVIRLLFPFTITWI